MLFLIGAVQAVNILDFMMVSPLGPDFATGLDIPTARIGWVVGSYTVAAAIAGFAGSFFLERFDRRRALAFAMLGLSIGTLAGAFATDLWTLMAARCLAGLFGGPATSIALAIIADAIPAERRGRAMGAVAGAFSIASILGVPAGLRLAKWGGWRLPFIVLAAIGIAITSAVVLALPSMRQHLIDGAAQRTTLAQLLRRRVVLLSYGMTACAMLAGFLVIPNLSAYIQKNLGFPRDDVELLYAYGGACSFITMRLAGRAVDRFGSFTVGTAGSVLTGTLTWMWFIAAPDTIPVTAYFIAFMVVMPLRNVAYNTLTSKVPEPAERARFVSMQSMVQHLASGLGAAVPGKVLGSLPDGRLLHISEVAWISIGVAALVPAFLYAVEREVKRTIRSRL